VPASTAPDVMGLLIAWQQGDRGALDRLLPVVYSELRNLAHGRTCARSPGLATLHGEERASGLVGEPRP
jgi:hypothetical protein